MSAASVGSSIASYASSFVGQIPYIFGGVPNLASVASKGVADCSGFVMAVMSKFGLSLSHDADTQYAQTKQYSVGTNISNLVPGDLLFFGRWSVPDQDTQAGGPNGIQHVGIYLGNGKFVQEGSASSNVNIADLSTYSANFMYATRPENSPAMSGDNSKDTTTTTTGTSGDGSTSSIGSWVVGTGVKSWGIDLNPADAVAKAIAQVGNAFASIFTGIANSVQDIAFTAFVIVMAAIFIIGGLMLLKPKETEDAAVKVVEVAGA